MKKILLYGVVVWLIPFIVSVCIFPLKTSEPKLFESIMPMVLVVCVVSCVVSHSRSGEVNASAGLTLGAVWLLISWGGDALMFSAGPMQMSFANYMKDIGIGYLIIPIITIGFGCVAGRSTATTSAPTAQLSSAA